eukprot:CAMPEP_0117665114 /NCGR_PEP_ID=MMETSP0804-20121206/9625_1 /TAXON_ID=1074897 /ORGANISM="Tetraselmis astigmatica, Strain CCMP880" /LENGTH=32 /DNA_ID= /DNA_START= /DNA_END= /DNA_ORIENTATION=
MVASCVTGILAHREAGAIWGFAPDVLKVPVHV